MNWHPPYYFNQNQPQPEKAMPTALQQAFPSLRITRYAIGKVQCYATSVREVLGRTVEVYGFLLAKTDAGLERIVSDALLANGQVSNAAHVSLSPEFVVEAGKEVSGLNMRVIGWWHSHGSVSPFLSGIDVENNYTVLRQVAASNRLTVPVQAPVPVELVSDASGCQPLKPYVRIESTDDSLLQRLGSLKAMLYPVSVVGFSYSVVVNERGDPPCAAVSVTEWSPALNLPTDKTYSIQVAVVEDGNEKKNVDESLIAAEIQSRVSVMKWPLFNHWIVKEPYGGRAWDENGTPVKQKKGDKK